MNVTKVTLRQSVHRAFVLARIVVLYGLVLVACARKGGGNEHPGPDASGGLSADGSTAPATTASPTGVVAPEVNPLREMPAVAVGSPTVSRLRGELGPALEGAVEALMAVCLKKTKAGPDLSRSPLANSALAKDERFREINATCAVPDGGFKGMRTFAPLRGQLAGSRDGGGTGLRSGNDQLMVYCPSQWSSQPNAVDVSLRRSTALMEAEVVVTITDSEPCLEQDAQEARRANDLAVDEAFAPSLARLEREADALGAACPKAQSTNSLARVPLTPLEDDPTILQVEDTCVYSMAFGIMDRKTYEKSLKPTQGADGGVVQRHHEIHKPGRLLKLTAPSSRAADGWDLTLLRRAPFGTVEVSVTVARPSREH